MLYEIWNKHLQKCLYVINWEGWGGLPVLSFMTFRFNWNCWYITSANLRGWGIVVFFIQGGPYKQIYLTKSYPIAISLKSNTFKISFYVLKASDSAHDSSEIGFNRINWDLLCFCNTKVFSIYIYKSKAPWGKNFKKFTGLK